MTRDRFAVGLAIGDGGEEGQEEGLEVADVEVEDQYKTLVNRSEQKLL